MNEHKLINVVKFANISRPIPRTVLSSSDQKYAEVSTFKGNFFLSLLIQEHQPDLNIDGSSTARDPNLFTISYHLDTPYCQRVPILPEQLILLNLSLFRRKIYIRLK